MVRETKSDRIFNVVNLFLVTVTMLVVLYPIIYVVSASFSSATALVSGKVYFLPVKPTLKGYKELLSASAVWRGYLNSIIYTITYMVISSSVTILAAYPLSRKDFAPRNVIMLIFSFTMWFGGGMIPSYLVVRGLGMLDTMWALVIPGAMGVYNTIIARTFFQSNIPDSLLESAKLDGCSDFMFLIKIVIPLSKAIIAVIMLYVGVGMWNSYMGAFLYISNNKKMPLQIILRQIIIMNQSIAREASNMSAVNAAMMGLNEEQFQEQLFLNELLKYSLIIVSSLPVLVAYPFVQKYFIKGVMIGAIKG